MHDIWNPWHGCRKCSEGCDHCYMYTLDRLRGQDGAAIFRTGSFDYPLRRTRGGGWQVRSGEQLRVCMTSDFFLAEADRWRPEAWDIIHRRPDVMFFLVTKRPQRIPECLPPDWGEGYENVMIGCTTENQKEADRRLPVFRALPIRYRMIVAAPLLERLDLTPYLDEKIREVSVGGESGTQARVCDYDWVLSLREQCRAAGVDFCFHQTGARFRKDGKLYRIPRAQQRPQARRANIDLGACGPGPQNTSKEIL